MPAQIDAGIMGFSNGNSLIQDGQRYVVAAVVSHTEITMADHNQQECQPRKLKWQLRKKTLELRNDNNIIKATFYGVWLLPVMLQSLPLKKWPLPVTLMVISDH